MGYCCIVGLTFSLRWVLALFRVTWRRGSAEAERGSVYFFFFFQEDDGIRDVGVTGVQFCFPSRRRHTRCSRDWSSVFCFKQKTAYEM